MPQQDLALRQCLEYGLRAGHQRKATFQHVRRPAQVACGFQLIASVPQQLPLRGARLFGHRHAGAVVVLDQRDGLAVGVARFADDDGHVVVVAEHVLRRAPAALAGNDLVQVAAGDRADDDGLDHAERADTLLKFGHLVRIEVLTGILPVDDPQDR